MVKYYTLEEAARILQTTPTKLREMAKKNEVRAFQDRGNLRFRSTEIDELARQSGLGSNPDLPLGEGQAPGGAPDPREVVSLGEEPSSGPASGRKSPPPKAASDSDVRLVSDGSDVDFNIQQPAAPPHPPEDVEGSGPESGVRLVPMDESSEEPAFQEIPSDSEISVGEEAASGSNILSSGSPKKPSDSDIRLADQGSSDEHRDAAHVTEEIDLDAESLAASRGSEEGNVNLPTSSPFELSQNDLDSPPSEDSSSDFELSLPPVSSEGNEDVPILEDEVNLDEEGRGSGINLGTPSDRGISLEQGGSDEMDFQLRADEQEEEAGDSDDSSSDFELSLPDEGLENSEDSSSEFELSLDADDDLALGSEDSSSEFELSLDAGESTGEESSSEFELTLDEDSSSDFELEGLGDEGSDSEFELTLDDEGGLEVEDLQEEDQDIFETDINIPSLDDESGSEAVALEDIDEDAQTSDFDLDVAEGLEDDLVVDVDEEAEAGAATVQRPRRPRRQAAVEEEDLEDLDVDVAVEEEEEEEPLVSAGPPAPQPWGPIPAVFLFPAVLILFFVGIMSYEMVSGMWGYKRSTPVSRWVVDGLARTVVDENLPK
jgi:excisionase family DNA binding protein